jgi:hypothetical protein
LKTSAFDCRHNLLRQQPDGFSLSGIEHLDDEVLDIRKRSPFLPSAQEGRSLLPGML